MLQYPINVYPDKVAFDSTKSSYDRNLSFTFKGDLLTCVYYKVYNYDTQALVASGVFKNADLSPKAYNNDNVTISNLFANLANGRYILQMMHTQTSVAANGTTFQNVYDRYVSRGKLRADYTALSTSMTIATGINLIYEWNKNNSVYSKTTESATSGGSTQIIDTSSIIIDVGGYATSIDSYNAETGVITLSSGQHMTADIASGTEYKLYANYLISEQYYFEVATEPSIQALSQDNGTDIWVTWDARGGEFKGHYWQGQGISRSNNMLKYYIINLQKKRSSSVWDDILTTDKIYSQNIDWRFYDDYDATELAGGNYESRRYKITLTCVMQNGMSFTKEYEAVAPQRSATEIISDFAVTYSDKFNEIQMQWTEPSGTNKAYRIYRINADDRYNKNTQQDKSSWTYALNPHKILIGDSGAASGFDDRFASQCGKFRYMIVPYNSTSGATDIYTAYVTDVITSNFDGYTLTACYDTGKNADGKLLYKQGDTWKFMCDIDDTDNQQNINKEMHIGNGKYSTATKTDNNYLTGKLSGYIGYMNCSTKEFEDDIEVVKAWRRFLAQDAIYVLRSPKGDVWLVNIVENAVTKYEEAHLEFLYSLHSRGLSVAT